MSNLLTVLGIIVPLLGAFAIYKYRNRIIWDVTSIDVKVPEDDPDVKISPSWSRLYAERIEIRNLGLRNLENVELHLAFPGRPISLEVSNPSTLSKSAIKTEWNDGILKIIMANLPSGERFHLDASRTGMPIGVIDRMKGTGGRYRLVWKRRYESSQNASTAILGLVMAILLALHLIFDGKVFG